MRIIIKFILRNIYEKKLRTFLILFSIILSSALFFASQAITDNVVNMFIEDARQFYSEADIMIYPGRNSPQGYIPRSENAFFAPKAEYMVGVFQHGAYFNPERNKTVTVNLRGMTLDDMNAMCRLYVDGESEIGAFTGRRVILSKSTSEKYGLKTGDSIKLEINNKKYRFTICAVVQPEGFFAETGQTSNMIVPKSALSAIYGRNDITNMIFVKLKDGIDLGESIDELKSKYNRYEVGEPVSEEDMKRNVESMSVGFMMMTVVVAFMSIFIIYTSFKVITLERLPMIGTFRSIGATRRTTDFVLLAESLLYGVIGGIIGCILGIGVLYLITIAITPPYARGFGINLEYSPAQMISAFVIAVAISLASSVLPIIKVSGIPLKEVVLNAIDKKEKSRNLRYILGICLLFLYVIIPPIAPEGMAQIFDTVSMLSSITGLILLIPVIMSGFLAIFEKVYAVLFGNIGAVAARNLRRNKSVLNNISLLTIAISSLIMITTVSNSVLLEVASFFTRNTSFQIFMVVSEADRAFEQSLLTVDGVKQVCGNRCIYGVEAVGLDYEISAVNGVNTSKFPDFYALDMEGDVKAAFEALNNERSMIISSVLNEKLGLDIGDCMTLKMNNRDISYKIAGIQNTMMNNGSNILIAEKYFKIDTGMKYYNEIFIKTDADPDGVVEAINKKYLRLSPYVTTMADMERNNYEVNKGVFSSMEAFAYLTLVIGIFGIINNYIISFIERRRSLAMYRSIGMSRRQILKMMSVEAFTGGIVGGIMGVVAGLMETYTIPYVMESLDFSMPIILNPSTLVISFAAGTVITLVASISPIAKSSKLNLIEALKYE